MKAETLGLALALGLALVAAIIGWIRSWILGSQLRQLRGERQDQAITVESLRDQLGEADRALVAARAAGDLVDQLAQERKRAQRVPRETAAEGGGE